MRWLRPAFQAAALAPEQAVIDTPEADAEPAAAVLPIDKRPWPAGLPEQIKVVAEVLGGTGHALTVEQLAARFTAHGRWRGRLSTILQTLEAIGRARAVGTDAWQLQ